MDQTIHRDYHQKKLYIQLIDILKKRLQNGEWLVGSQIPIEDELCKIYNVSRATVRSAILDLVRQGYLTRQQGKGTFVCKKVISEELIVLASFKELMFESGVNYSTKVLSQTIIMPVDDLDLKLNIPEDEHIIYFKRLRIIDNEPVLLKETYIPYHICPQLLEEDVENNSILELLETKYGIKLTKVKGCIEIANLTKDEADLLGLTEGSQALLFTQQFYTNDTVVKYTRTIKRSDRFKFYLEFERREA